MPAYRFCFHTLDERIVGEEFHACSDDDAAIVFARSVATQQPVVIVWLGKRFIDRVTRDAPSNEL